MIRSAALEATHAFADTSAAAPPALRRPTQVHGVRIASAGDDRLGEADGIVASTPGTTIGIVTADCVPVLAVAGRATAAIHAGWRGLAAGVLENGVAALRAASDGEPVTAVVGPAADICCYEVDAPVLDALAERYADAVAAETTATRPGHARLGLPEIAARALAAAGVERVERALPAGRCTICDPRFESYRRDGDAAGRMVHWITCR